MTSASAAQWAQVCIEIQPYLDKMTRDTVDLVKDKAIPEQLQQIAAYYFQLQGKRLRPTVTLLMSHAVCHPDAKAFDDPQIELAGIVEMIHTASLLHDDVLDEATMRRDVPSANAKFGNKLTVMTGDYLLGYSCWRLGKLGNCEVVELISTVLKDLIEGEFQQLSTSTDFDHYIRKSYLKTASLLANGCKSAAILSGAPRDRVNAAEEYGKNIGIAFQIVDDLLDFTSSSQQLGKVAGVDLSLGLATAPVLYARQEFPELDELISRKFSTEGDIERAQELVSKSQGIKKTAQLAAKYSQLAIDSLSHFPPSPARAALLALATELLSRSR